MTLVLLDLDGTLMDSAPGITRSAAHAFRVLGLPVPDDAALRSFVGPPIGDSLRAHGVPADRVADGVAAYREVFRETGMWENAVFEGIPAQLALLREAGCTLAVATSKPEVFAVPIAERFGLAPLIDGVFGAPLDESGSKAGVIAKALAALGWSGEPALMVGDRVYDVVGAREHGIDTLGVSWGYPTGDELVQAGAVQVIDDVADLAPTALTLLARPTVSPTAHPSAPTP
ncbi:Haloacid dehalogenase domain protein hydrolase [Xylanimonas cellulosilytica DSM 15894]|uniref:Haloacid dehalogenase domain protein hydrolase n=1 Tax=Xylanimonas cellulosilytica (strain DSM 15894 / JCM 12276 / CECT 5975 / KCTC 9989 / LMG 20990 / NBRC 107835 / XIL07) TaxID=446471 RepID=D1BVD2_XYLCX|nr:HAD hydrolase-like protein [Xylanimonas cellulosilytica]ACZ29403.1 Haloacid dehalogenase domain protein hydrolase [Xylanimonas cellulosilytica DSM 15894]